MSQYRPPSQAHTHRQSPFRASINPSKSFGGVVAGGHGKSKSSKKKSK